MRTLVFATHNLHKLREVRDMLPHDSIRLVGLTDLGQMEPLPETSATIEGNALQKARYVKEHYGYDCFADDTGLEVEALDGAPGVYSARYAGEACDSAANVRKLLEALRDTDHRNHDRGPRRGRLRLRSHLPPRRLRPHLRRTLP